MSPAGARTTVALYWRVHWASAPAFSAENAWSAPWGWYTAPDDWRDPEGRRRGYSCFTSPEGLVEYFTRGGADLPLLLDEHVVVFAGEEVGDGDDGECLVVPAARPRPRWLRYADVRRIVTSRERAERLERRRRWRADRAWAKAQAEQARRRARAIEQARAELGGVVRQLVERELAGNPASRFDVDWLAASLERLADALGIEVEREKIQPGWPVIPADLRRK